MSQGSIFLLKELLMNFLFIISLITKKKVSLLDLFEATGGVEDC
jgi:hypothetical protein